MQAVTTGSPSCPSPKECCAQRSNSKGVVISLAQNELTRDMFMARVRGPHPTDTRCLGTAGGRSHKRLI